MERLNIEMDEADLPLKLREAMADALRQKSERDAKHRADRALLDMKLNAAGYELADKCFIGSVSLLLSYSTTDAVQETLATLMHLAAEHGSRIAAVSVSGMLVSYEQAHDHLVAVGNGIGENLVEGYDIDALREKSREALALVQRLTFGGNPPRAH